MHTFNQTFIANYNAQEYCALLHTHVFTLYLDTDKSCYPVLTGALDQTSLNVTVESYVQYFVS